jgi:nicotinate phosphoribosyltransferase
MDNPCIQSFLDTDLYKLTMGQVIFNQFPNAVAKYRLTVRDKNHNFRPGFTSELADQIRHLSNLSLTRAEREWLAAHAPWLKASYLDFLAGYRFDHDGVNICDFNGDVSVEFYGPWYREVLKEVMFMAIISELNFRGRKPAEGWERTIEEKAVEMKREPVSWIDFGTRRRFSFAVQDAVCRIMREYSSPFRGTSNPHLAMKYRIPVHGTYAHELVMGMQGLHGIRGCNRAAMDAWVREYRGNLGIALTDTVTTPAFLQDFDAFYAKLFDGVRIDSGDPFSVGDMVIRHYEKLGIDPRSKVLVFSDSLDPKKAIKLQKYFGHQTKITCGIGTNLSNDVGHKPLNMVIKLVAIDFGSGWVDLLKMSDDPGKFLGPPSARDEANRVFGLGARG